jgi:hypothetical protein
MSRTMRIVLTGVLAAGALLTGGVALAAGPSSPPLDGVVVEQSGPTTLRPVQNPAPENPAPEDCPWQNGSDTGTAGAAGQL